MKFCEKTVSNKDEFTETDDALLFIGNKAETKMRESFIENFHAFLFAY